MLIGIKKKFKDYFIKILNIPYINNQKVNLNKFFIIEII